MMGFKLMVTKSRYYFLEFIPYYRRKIGCCSTLRSVTLTKSKFLKLSKISINKNEVVGRAGEPDSPFLSPLIHSTCWNVSIVCLSNTILTTFYNHLWVYNFFRCETKQKVVPVFFSLQTLPVCGAVKISTRSLSSSVCPYTLATLLVGYFSCVVSGFSVFSISPHLLQQLKRKKQTGRRAHQISTLFLAAYTHLYDSSVIARCFHLLMGNLTFHSNTKKPEFSPNRVTRKD